MPVTKEKKNKFIVDNDAVTSVTTDLSSLNGKSLKKLTASEKDNLLLAMGKMLGVVSTDGVVTLSEIAGPKKESK